MEPTTTIEMGASNLNGYLKNVQKQSIGNSHINQNHINTNNRTTVKSIIDENRRESLKDKSNLILPIKENGEPNENYIDFLPEYPPIPKQNFGVFSFLFPEMNVRNREYFYFEEFVKQWGFHSTLFTVHDFMYYLSFKYKLNADNLIKDLEDFIQTEDQISKRCDVFNDFETYATTHSKQLEKKYKEIYGSESSVRGFVHLGSFNTIEEANARSKQIRKLNPNFSVFVGENFRWVPLSPIIEDKEHIDYGEAELNQMYKEKMKQYRQAKEAFEERVYLAKQEAMERNLENVEKYGATVTQTLNEKGELVNLRKEKESDVSERDPVIEKDVKTETKQP